MISAFVAAVRGASLTTGAHTLNGRQFRVALPASTPAPVLIVLHGNGGEGQGMMNSITGGNPDLAEAYIVVAPDGPEKSWNIVAEASDQDDALYVGQQLVSHLVTFDNVSPTFTVLGSSNGAALTHRIAIENDDARITHLVFQVSQLNTHQYRSGSFYVGGSDNTYATVKASLSSRSLLQIVGEEDDVIPAGGGGSAIDGDGGSKLAFNHWEDSVHAYAQAYGYSGAKAAYSVDDADIAESLEVRL